MSLLDQLPRLSAYDPGAAGEGGLDPLGLSAIADRLADILAPGVRARMRLPRFVTISAVGAIACQTLYGLTADQGKTTADIAFEWLVVEAMVRNPGAGRLVGLPGNQKAARAKAANERLSRRTYLSGPRVFGFTGVYRPFSRDAGVLTLEDLPAPNAAKLANAWERDFKLQGFVDGVSTTRGGQLRRNITDACKHTLEKGQCTAPPTGQLLRNLSDFLAPREAQSNERRALRQLIVLGEHEIRNELTAKMVAQPPSEGVTQRDLVLQLLTGTSKQTRKALQAAFDYEEAATALDKTFRHFLHYTTQQHGSVIRRSDALLSPGLAALAPRIGGLVHKAIGSVAELDDGLLSTETERELRLFARHFKSCQLLDTLIQRHEEVQARRKKISWLDQLAGAWTVRTPYRNQNDELKDGIWTHPMRLVTLANFLAETA